MSLHKRVERLEAAVGGGGVHLEQLDGSVRVFHHHECWAAVFGACLSLSFKKPEGAVFDALRGATDESRELFEQEFGAINTAVVGRAEDGIWAEVYEYDPADDEVRCTYHAPGSEGAQAAFESAAREGAF